jgi:hypothetical protein
MKNKTSKHNLLKKQACDKFLNKPLLQMLLRVFV